MSTRKRMSRGGRIAAAIGLSASITTILALLVLKPAEAQPGPGSAQVTLEPVGSGSAKAGSAKGSAAKAGSGSAKAGSATANGSASAAGAGSAGPAIGGVGAGGVGAGSAGSAGAGSGAGSAVGAGSAGSGSAVLEATGSGSAATGSGSGSDAGSGAGSGSDAATPAKPKATKVTEVVCGKTPSKYIVTPDYNAALAFDDPKRDPQLKSNDIEVNDIVEFRLDKSPVDVIPDPTASDINLKAPAGKTTCLVFNAEGDYGFHSSSNLHGKLNARAWYTRLAERHIDDMSGGTYWMPRAVNKAADQSDQMFYAVLALSVFFFVAIAVAVVYLTIKYRHRPGHKSEKSATHNDALEITWTIIPTIITVFLFWYGWRSYIHVVTPPTAAIEIGVTAQRWTWEFKHSNGVKDVDLHVPAGQPVRLVMTSTDVLHSFYAPALRVKQDIIPRRYTYVWFDAQRPGTYRLNCAEYCGTNHSQMGINAEGRRAVVVVHEPGKYEKYLADKEALERNMAPDALGRLLYEKKGCNGCHTIDGSAKIGPTFKGDYGTTYQFGGNTIKVDENYIRESLMAPQAKARAGYPPSMPSFEGSLKEVEIEGIIAYIKSLK